MVARSGRAGGARRLRARARGGDAGEARWWKGNTHTHTLWSDGDGAPELVADRYREAGYDFLVLSDHNVLSAGERWFPVSEAGGEPADAGAGGGAAASASARTRSRRARRPPGGTEMRLVTLAELRARFEAPGSSSSSRARRSRRRAGRRRRAPGPRQRGQPRAARPAAGGGRSARCTTTSTRSSRRGGARRRPVLAHVNHPNFGWGADLGGRRARRERPVLRGLQRSSRRPATPATRAHPGTEAMWDRALTLRLTASWGSACCTASPRTTRTTTTARRRRRRRPRLGHGPRARRSTAERSSRPCTPATSTRRAASTLDDVRRRRRRARRRRAERAGGDVRDALHRHAPRAARPSGRSARCWRRPRRPRAVRLRGATSCTCARVVTSSRPHPNPYAAGDPQRAWVQPVVP